MNKITNKFLLTRDKVIPEMAKLMPEIIKCIDRNMIECLQTLFNKIMESDYYPTSWNQGLICSICKSS